MMDRGAALQDGGHGWHEIADRHGPGIIFGKKERCVVREKSPKVFSRLRVDIAAITRFQSLDCFDRNQAIKMLHPLSPVSSIAVEVYFRCLII